MALDTTTGAATAESYIDVASATTYHSLRENTAWGDLSTAEKEAALRKATEYLDSTYCDMWKGLRVDSVQALDWPRAGVTKDGYSVDDDTIPELIQRATAELALRASAGDLLADQTRGVLSKTIGPISTVYDPASPQTKRFPLVHRLIAPFITGRSGVNTQLVRS